MNYKKSIYDLYFYEKCEVLPIGLYRPSLNFKLNSKSDTNASSYPLFIYLSNSTSKRSRKFDRPRLLSGKPSFIEMRSQKIVTLNQHLHSKRVH